VETLRRAVPLLRSDYRFEPCGTQGHTYGMASWIPYYGTGVTDSGDYVVRSHWCPCLGIGRPEPRRPGLDWTPYRRMMSEWRKAADYQLGDYYPLSPYSLDNSAWIAWQFHRPEQGRGMVQAFRRAESPYESARLSLHGLEPDAHYVVSNLDSHESQKLTGRELAKPGLLITASARPSAIVLYYEKEQ
jgi:alpha-galactosidase